MRQPNPQADHEAELERLIEKRIKIASTETTSDDLVVQIAWLADGKDVWNRTNSNRGNSPADARRYIISSVTRLIAAENCRLLDCILALPEMQSESLDMPHTEENVTRHVAARSKNALRDQLRNRIEEMK